MTATTKTSTLITLPPRPAGLITSMARVEGYVGEADQWLEQGFSPREFLNSKLRERQDAQRAKERENVPEPPQVDQAKVTRALQWAARAVNRIERWQLPPGATWKDVEKKLQRADRSHVIGVLLGGTPEDREFWKQLPYQGTGLVPPSPQPAGYATIFLDADIDVLGFNGLLKFIGDELAGITRKAEQDRKAAERIARNEQAERERAALLRNFEIPVF